MAAAAGWTAGPPAPPPSSALDRREAQAAPTYSPERPASLTSVEARGGPSSPPPAAPRAEGVSLCLPQAARGAVRATSAATGTRPRSAPSVRRAWPWGRMDARGAWGGWLDSGTPREEPRVRLAGRSDGAGRAHAPRSAASAAWRLGVALAAGRGGRSPPTSGRCYPCSNRQVVEETYRNASCVDGLLDAAVEEAGGAG